MRNTNDGGTGSSVSMAPAFGQMPSGQRLSSSHRCVPQAPQKTRQPSAVRVERVAAAHDVDAADPAGALAADRAEAELVRIRRVRLDGEVDLAALTGAFEAH